MSVSHVNQKLSFPSISFLLEHDLRLWLPQRGHKLRALSVLGLEVWPYLLLVMYYFYFVWVLRGLDWCQDAVAAGGWKT